MKQWNPKMYECSHGYILYLLIRNTLGIGTISRLSFKSNHSILINKESPIDLGKFYLQPIDSRWRMV